MTEKLKYISGYLFVVTALYFCAACTQVEQSSYSAPTTQYTHASYTPAPMITPSTAKSSNNSVMEISSNNMWYWY